MYIIIICVKGGSQSFTVFETQSSKYVFIPTPVYNCIRYCGSQNVLSPRHLQMFNKSSKYAEIDYLKS